MEPIINNTNIPQFGTPHSGQSSKIKIFVISLIILAAAVFNLWYYFYYVSVPVVEAPEVLLPPTDEEKAAIITDLQTRTAKISNEDREQMMKGLSAQSNTDVKIEDREAATKSFQN
ncbi:MAG: hypothetical protein V4509_02145 [Patescibacteria group bacterium]